MTASQPAALSELVPEIVAECRRAFADPDLELEAAEPAPEGHSGFTYLLRLGGASGTRRAVIRVPPPRARPVGAADVLRQGRILSALHVAGIPVPAVLAMVPGERTAAGRPFLLMQTVEAENAAQAARSTPPSRLLRSALDVQARIAALPLAATGLADEPVHAALRQVERWEPLIERGPADLTRGWQQLAAALRRRHPTAGAGGLAHGDYQFGNLLFHGGAVAAVVDWEIAELGPRQVDVACLCVSAIRGRFPGDQVPGGLPITLSEVLAAAGEPDPDLAWHVAAGCFKYAAILAYNLDLHLRGRRVDPLYERLRETIRGLIEAGRQIMSAGLSEMQ
jgi:aminoglycoside phosphotransferase (APT) family kinase protein